MDSEDIGARVRAAVAYAGMGDEAAAEAMGFSKRTLARVQDNDRDLTIIEAKALAKATGVPLAFLTDGWASVVELARIDANLERLIQTVDSKQLDDRISQVLAKAMGQSTPEVDPPPTTHARGKRAKASRPRRAA